MGTTQNGKESLVAENPREVRERCVQMLQSAEMGHTAADFFKCCRPFHAKTERPVAGRFEYWGRMQSSCSAWAQMSKRDRDILVAGAEDGAHWRGEPVAQYQDVWNETMHMRKVGPAEYRKQSVKKLHEALQ